ncbi:MAG: pyridoxamine 5'-phosphate oxidase family protein [Deltaproteobacteria bacterium]|nr:pyridoxamine 5'-phosphate oxidase family protein [Deltaproteobacteria bacterium]MBW1961938.1 pyridoxamine 5'-phosphate oxidase family protein [Deltaproteobacteria bacterium]MBW2151872.1 pyridoxamine 5'-phosphate oxidase family protein [Deltaproteobacteria bacterium]
MRRKEKEIRQRAEIDAVIKKSTVCRLAMAEGNLPYVVPLCFGYSDNTLYFHSAKEGRKLDIIRKNNLVCFEFDIDQEIINKGKNACRWSMKYQSVIGYGKAFILEEPMSKRRGLEIIMRQYAAGSFEYQDSKIDETVVIKVEIEQITGKQSE